MTMTETLRGLQKDTGLEAAPVNALYLKLRSWAPASVEYADVGSPHLTRMDFCACMVREGLAPGTALAHRFFRMFDTDNAASIDAAKFVRGWGRLAPSAPAEDRLSVLVELFGVDTPGWLRIPETADMLSFCYKTAAGCSHRLEHLDDDLCRMLKATGTNNDGCVNTSMLTKILKVPEFREVLLGALDAKFAQAVGAQAHGGYPDMLHRTTVHDGRPGTQPVLGTPKNLWICGPGGSLGYGGK